MGVEERRLQRCEGIGLRGKGSVDMARHTLLQKRVERCRNLLKVGHITSVDVTSLQEPPNLGLGRGVFCLAQRLGIRLGQGESPWSNDMPKVVDRLREEVALRQLEGYVE